MHLSTGGSSSAGSKRDIEFRWVGSFEGLPDGGPRAEEQTLLARRTRRSVVELFDASFAEGFGADEQRSRGRPAIPCPPLAGSAMALALPTSSAGSGDMMTSFGPATGLLDPHATISCPHIGSESPSAQGRWQPNRNSRSSGCAARKRIQYTFQCAEKLHFTYFNVRTSYTFDCGLCVTVLSV